MNDTEPGDKLVELLFRNGTLTIVGIVLSFSLGFLTQWANNPVPWTLIDLPTLLLIGTGIVLQVISLIGLLRHDSLIRKNFDRATAHFVAGVSLSATGVVLAIVIDFIQIVT